VVDGARTKIDRELRADLPELLWLYQMGIVLFRVHDRSPDQADVTQVSGCGGDA